MKIQGKNRKEMLRKRGGINMILKETVKCQWYLPTTGDITEHLINAITTIWNERNSHFKGIKRLPDGQIVIEYTKEEVYPEDLLYPLGT